MLKTSKISLFLLTLLIYGSWFLSNRHIASDLHLAFKKDLLEYFSFPYTWGARAAVGMGEYALSVLWNWPVGLFYGFLDKLGISFDIAVKVFLLFGFLAIGCFSLNKLLGRLNISPLGESIAGVFFLINTYALLLVDGGQINLAVSYSLLPLAFVLYKDAIEEDIWRKRILFSLGLLAVSVFDIRIVYFVVLLITLNFLFEFISISHKKRLAVTTNYLMLGLVSGVVLAGFHAYWILPALLAKAPVLPATYQRVTQTSFLSFAAWKHALLLLQPHWYKNVFGKVAPIRAEFMLVPILVFLAPLLRRKSREVGFWLLVALVSVFLVKGANPPLPGVYPWLFANVPGFSLFRDPTKFFFLVALSYSVLLGVTVDEVTKRLPKIKTAIVVVLAAYFVVLARPVWLGRMTGTFSKPIYEKEYFGLAEKFEEDKDFGRVFWIPTKAPLGYSSPIHPSVEASRLVQKRPFAIGTVGTYETFNFLREAPFMGELFDIAAIKYLAYPFPDTKREELKQDNIDYYYAFLNQLSNFPWVKEKVNEPPVAVLETKKHQEHFFVAPNTWFIVGSDRIYWDLADTGFKLAENALIFVEERGGVAKRLAEIPDARVVLYDKELIDLAASFLPADKFIFPAAQLDFDPDETGWWKREAFDLISWRAFLQEKYGLDNLDFDYGGGWAVGEGVKAKELKVKSGEFSKGNVLLARLMKSSSGGKVEFYQGNNLIGEVETKTEKPEKVKVKLTGYAEIPDQIFEYDGADFSWFEIGKLKQDAEITIKTKGGINVINALASVPEADWQKVVEKASGLQSEGKMLSWDNLSEAEKGKLFQANSDVRVFHERVSPTHYKVKISGLDSPVTLAFSETYDSLWELEGQTSYPLYSLINGFTVEEDGEHDVYFSAQKYVLPGLVISGLTLILVFSALIIYRPKP